MPSSCDEDDSSASCPCVNNTLRPLRVLVSSEFWSVSALTLKTMVQPSGRALTPFAGCMCSGFGVSVQGDIAEMPQAGMGWSAEEVGYPGAGGDQLVPALFKDQ